MATRCQSWRAVAARLKESSSFLPYPGNLALESASMVVLVIVAFMELKEVQERKRNFAERLVCRVEDISNLIEHHERQLRRDHGSSSFILRFVDSMEGIHVFVAALIPENVEKAMPRRLWSKTSAVVGAAFGQAVVQEAEQGFEAHWRTLDSLHLEFQTYLLSSQTTMGPHQLIKHPDIQVFWRCRLTNALDAPWPYFWDHFLDEYPNLRETLSEDQAGHEMREIFQSLTRPRNKDVVDPAGLNRVFQPIDEPVEKIVRARLQSRPSSNSASELPVWTTSHTEKLYSDSRPHAQLQSRLSSNSRFSSNSASTLLSAQGEVQQWRGYYVQASSRGAMEFEIFVTDDNHQVLGSGEDSVGKFTIEGKELLANINWTKHYVDAHIVNYKGRKLGREHMEGSWSLSVDSFGDLSHGEFFLKRVENLEDAIVHRHQVDWLYESYLLNRLRVWRGFYKKFGEQFEMTTSFVFTPSGRIHGKGVDAIGDFTWCGIFCKNNDYGRMEVSLIKQYFQEHAISYKGHIEEYQSDHIEEHQSGLLFMRGTWTIIEDNCSGIFELQPIMQPFNEEAFKL